MDWSISRNLTTTPSSTKLHESHESLRFEWNRGVYDYTCTTGAVFRIGLSSIARLDCIETVADRLRPPDIGPDGACATLEQ